MKTALLALTLLLTATTSFAKPKGFYEEVTGLDVLQDHYLNQYDDVSDPAQAFRITMPDNFRLVSVDVESGGNSICGIANYAWDKKTFTLEGFNLETDETGCAMILNIYEKGANKYYKATYTIDQVGT